MREVVERKPVEWAFVDTPQLCGPAQNSPLFRCVQNNELHFERMGETSIKSEIHLDKLVLTNDLFFVPLLFSLRSWGEQAVQQSLLHSSWLTLFTVYGKDTVLWRIWLIPPKNASFLLAKALGFLLLASWLSNPPVHVSTHLAANTVRIWLLRHDLPLTLRLLRHRWSLQSGA